jgi:hypothetical protein
MLIEFYNLAMASTLALAGVLLVRDYARFLRSVHTLQAKVTSIQHVFVPTLDGKPKETKNTVESGYYPVVQYQTKQGPVSFTCIDSAVVDRFHIGDKIRLRISKSRRKADRTCKTFTLLAMMLVMLSFGLVAGASFPGFYLAPTYIFTASLVIAACLCVIVRFKREQDECKSIQVLHNDSGRTQYCLQEPTAFKHWGQAVRDNHQVSKIRSSQALGLVCFAISAALLVVTMFPLFLNF